MEFLSSLVSYHRDAFAGPASIHNSATTSSSSSSGSSGGGGGGGGGGTTLSSAAAAATTTTPSSLTRTSKLLLFQGVTYAVTGMFMIVAPELFSKVLLFDEEHAHAIRHHPPTQSAYQFLGISLLVIGYFYIMGSRSNSIYFAKCTIVDRFLPLPLFFLYCLVSMNVPNVFTMAFLVIEPLYALIIAWSIYTQDKRILQTGGTIQKDE